MLFSSRQNKKSNQTRSCWLLRIELARDWNRWTNAISYRSPGLFKKVLWCSFPFIKPVPSVWSQVSVCLSSVWFLVVTVKNNIRISWKLNKHNLYLKWIHRKECAKKVLRIHYFLHIHLKYRLCFELFSHHSLLFSVRKTKNKSGLGSSKLEI